MMRKIWLTITVLVMVAMMIMPGLIAQEETGEKDKEDDSALRAQIAELARSSLVKVYFEFQRDPEEGRPEDYRMNRHVSDKTTLDSSGILLADSSVLIFDQAFEKKFIKSIKVVDVDNNEFEAELKSFMLDYHGAFLNIKGDKKPKGGLTFVDTGEVTPARKFYSALLFKENENWFISTEPFNLSPIVPYQTDSGLKTWSGVEAGWYSRSGFCPIIFNDEGQPIGCPLEGRVELEGKAYGWRGTDLMASQVIGAEELDKKIEETKKFYANYILEVKFTFRQPEKEKSDSYSRYSRHSYSDDDDNNTDIVEKKVYGMAVDKTKILIPRELHKELIHRIEDIEVTIGENKYKAKFLGVYEDFSAILIELEDANAITKPFNIYQAGKPQLNRAVMTFEAREKFGKRYEKVHYTRFTGITKGYKNKLHYVCDGEISNSAFLINFDGIPLGVVMTEKRDLADRISESGGGYYSRYSYGGYSSGGGNGKPYFFSEMKKYFTETAVCFDKRLVPLSDREMKRIIWLGVEFQSLSKELAEQLGCQKVTREGELGLLITHIHEDSPAAKANLQSNDILLKIQEEGKDDPIEFIFEGDEYSRMTPWPSANNYLNQILTQIGEGKKITLAYWRDDKEMTEEFVLEKAPYDYQSAEKYKDENIGLTVRELTYEVRYAWRLPKEFKAVIVSKVEEGSKSAIGGIRSLELLTKIDDVPIDSIEKFKKLMDAFSKDETKEKVRFTLEVMGKSRFVDVELKKGGSDEEEPPAPPEEEPGEEE